MQKHKDNVFAKKFHLLSSQESEEINWSSSASSDYENVSTNANKVCNFSKKTTRKRKRKQSIPKNISNLDITVIDITRCKSENSSKSYHASNTRSKSPILGSSQYFVPYKTKNEPGSPILSSKTLEHQSKGEIPSKSPIIVLKMTSPRVSPNVRKKLFKYDARRIDDVDKNANSIIANQNDCLDRRKYAKSENLEYRDTYQCKSNALRKSVHSTSEIKQESVLNLVTSSFLNKMNSTKFNTTFVVKDEMISLEEAKYSSEEILNLSPEKKHDSCIIEETPEPRLDHSSAMLKTSSVDLVKKVKSYFENQFSSESPSQQTISEVSTPRNNSKTSDDIEITNIPTQVLTSKNSNESKELDLFTDKDKKEKKMRYKKDGLAYRLNKLLKKQTASISLWQHERFLAANSNFVIPKGEFLAFRIYKVIYKYGCYLLEAMDFNDDNYMILINSCHHSDNILPDCIMKLYEPFTKIDFSLSYKLVINVTKFECVSVSK